MSNPFDTTTTTRFEQNAEQEFASERPCIIDRISLDIVTGTGLYTLPSYLINIKRITYLGWKVYPLPHRDLRQSYQSGTQQGRPLWYIFNNIGQLQLKFFPVPSETIAAITGPTLYGSDIANCCVVEFYRQPDFADFKIPAFFRQRLLTYYSNRRNFAMEGRTQDIKAANYWGKKYEAMKELYSNLLDDLNNKPRNLVASDNAQRPYGYTPPPPILPVSRFGISIDEPGY